MTSRVSRTRLPDREGFRIEWVRSARTTMSICLCLPDTLEVRTPVRTDRRRVDALLDSKHHWIRIQRSNLDRWVILTPRDFSDRERRLFHSTVSRMATDLLSGPMLSRCPHPAGFSVRRARTRWGSCSSSGRISINLMCADLPEELLEYVVAHELCHLVHLHHGPAFYRLLRQVLPDAEARRQRLRRYHIAAP